MSPRRTRELEAIAAGLMSEAGSYLAGIDWRPGLTCQVCATPVDPGEVKCNQCTPHAASGHPIADRVGFLTYALKHDSQAYRLLRGYKNPSPADAHTRVVAGLLAVGLRGHSACAQLLAGASSTGWAVVPSTSGRLALRDLVASLAQPGAQEVKVSHVPGAPGRLLDPTRWKVETSGPLPEQVILVDDSWVSGGNAQSVASVLKSAGVRDVSTLVIGRVIGTDWGPTKRYAEVNSPLPFDWERCPWTRGACPTIPA